MKTIAQQWQTMLDNNIIPCFELEKIDGDYIVVDVSLHDRGIMFELDTEDLPTYFSGNVEKLESNVYLYQYDECFDSLDYYLQEIYQEIIEGFVIANDIKLEQ